MVRHGEEIMRELPSLNKSGQIRERIEAMPCLDLKSIEGDEVLTFCANNRFPRASLSPQLVEGAEQ